MRGPGGRRWPEGHHVTVEGIPAGCGQAEHGAGAAAGSDLVHLHVPGLPFSVDGELMNRGRAEGQSGRPVGVGWCWADLCPAGTRSHVGCSCAR